MVKLQNLNGGVHLGVKRPCDEFTTEMCNSIVKKFKEENWLADFQELTNSSYTFIFAVGFPKTDRLAMRVPI
jgi:hypothetical protein